MTRSLLLLTILELPLLSGCILIANESHEPYAAERTPMVLGKLADERTGTPVSGAEVWFTLDPQLRGTSDRDGRFEIDSTQYHYSNTWHTLAGESRSRNPPLDPEIIITHTNWATRQIRWGQTPQTISLQKLPEPSAIQPWLTFDGHGVILQDGGAAQYLAPRSVMAIPGSASGPIHFGIYKNAEFRAPHVPDGTLRGIYVDFMQRVFTPHLTVLQGPNKLPFSADTDFGPTGGFHWNFYPSHESAGDIIRTEDPSYIYKLEFIR